MTLLPPRCHSHCNHSLSSFRYPCPWTCHSSCPQIQHESCTPHRVAWHAHSPQPWAHRSHHALHQNRLLKPRFDRPLTSRLSCITRKLLNQSICHFPGTFGPSNALWWHGVMWLSQGWEIISRFTSGILKRPASAGITAADKTLALVFALLAFSIFALALGRVIIFILALSNARHADMSSKYVHCWEVLWLGISSLANVAQTSKFFKER